MAFDPGQRDVFLKALLANTPDTIFASDARGMLTAFSRAGEATLGYAPGELTGRAARDLLDEPGSWDRLVNENAGEGRSGVWDVVLRCKDGDPVPGKLTLFPLGGSGGASSAGIGGIFVDVRKKRALQESLIRIDRLAEIGRTASEVIHEINNPLSIIGQVSGWMGVVIADARGMEPEDRDELEAAVNRIEEQVERCARLTRRLLVFAREMEPRKATFSIREILERSAGHLHTEFKHRDIDLVYDLGEEPLMICSDPGMLEQIFVNLMSNALYSLKEKGGGGRIVLKGEMCGGDAVVRVADTGTGIPEACMQKVGDLFFTTKPPGKGTGLGIAICRNLLQKLGGEMTFESEAGVGATFTVRIPLG